MLLGFYATWSPRPFDDLGQPSPDSTPIRRPLGLSPAQWLGMSGSILLFAGVFLPAFGLRWPGQSLLQVSAALDDIPLDALLVIVLAVVSVILAWRDHCVLLWLTGFGAQIALASSYALWRPPPQTGPSWICWNIPTSGLQEGWWIMELGISLLFGAGFLAELPPLRHWKPMPPTTESGQFPSSNAVSPT